MDRSLPRRFDISKFTFVFFALAVSIFGWGLQSKLSLYNPHMLTQTMPKAKLVLRDERSVLSEDHSLEHGNPIPNQKTAPWDSALLFGLAALILVPNRMNSLRKPGKAVRARVPANGTLLSALFFRPPPVLA
ncbi:MAG: hypothetical protein ACYCSN_00010 [Acidobacteriaceae bacterium]